MITASGSDSDFIITPDTPYLALTGELWGVYCEDLGENWLRCNGTIKAAAESYISPCMGLLPVTKSCGLRIHQGCRDRFPCHRGLAIPTCHTARAWCMCRDAGRDRLLTVSFKVVGGENVPGIPGACTTRNCMYLSRGPWEANIQTPQKSTASSRLMGWYTWPSRKQTYTKFISCDSSVERGEGIAYVFKKVFM